MPTLNELPDRSGEQGKQRGRQEAQNDRGKTEEGQIQLTTVYKCPECGEQAYFHPNIGAAILWCEEHGMLAIQQMQRGDVEKRRRMTEDQYEKFVSSQYTNGSQTEGESGGNQRHLIRYLYIVIFSGDFIPGNIPE